MAEIIGGNGSKVGAEKQRGRQNGKEAQSKGMELLASRLSREGRSVLLSLTCITNLQ
jgi:hypothetical protein